MYISSHSAKFDLIPEFSSCVSVCNSPSNTQYIVFSLLFVPCCFAVSQPAVICIQLARFDCVINHVRKDWRNPEDNLDISSEGFSSLCIHIFWGKSFYRKFQLSELHLLMSCSLSPVAHPFPLCLHFFLFLMLFLPSLPGLGKKWGVKHLCVFSVSGSEECRAR